MTFIETLQPTAKTGALSAESLLSTAKTSALPAESLLPTLRTAPLAWETLGAPLTGPAVIDALRGIAATAALAIEWQAILGAGSALETLHGIHKTSRTGISGWGGQWGHAWGQGPLASDIDVEIQARIQRLVALALETSGATGFITVTGTVWIETRRGGPIVVFPASRPGRIVFVEPGRTR